MDYDLQPSPIRTGHLVQSPVPGFAFGLWTPSIGGTATHTTQIGRYIKIGDVVFIEMHLVISIIGTGSTTVIQGLPFYAAANIRPISVEVAVSVTNIVSVIGRIGIGRNDIELISRTAASASGAANAIFQNNASAFASGFYFAA